MVAKESGRSFSDNTPRKRSFIVTLSEHWDYTQKAIANCKRYAKKTSFDLQKDLIHTGIHISSSTVRRRLLEADRKVKKQLKSSSLLNKLEKKYYNAQKM